MKVTFSRGRGDKIHISLDGEYFISADTAFFADCGVSNNQDIEGEELAAFVEAARSRCAFLGALRLLSIRDYGRTELIRKLREKGHAAEYAVYAVNRVEELGYIDDEAYAVNAMKRMCETKGYSVSRAKYELCAKGISREIADIAAQTIDSDPILCIIELLNTKFYGKTDDEKSLKRTVAALQRLGYRYSDIRRAIEQASDTQEY